MKHLLILLLTLMSTISFSQSKDTPYYLVENGDTIGIVISIEQAQQLDNDLELLGLFKQLQIDCDNVDANYVKVINALGEKIALFEVKVKDLESQGKAKDEEIKDLKMALERCQGGGDLCDEIIRIKDEEIKELKKEVFRQKLGKFVSVGLNTAVVIVTTIFLVKS